MQFQIVDCLTGEAFYTEKDPLIVHGRFKSLLDKYFDYSDPSINKVEAGYDPVTNDRVVTIYFVDYKKYRFVFPA